MLGVDKNQTNIGIKKISQEKYELLKENQNSILEPGTL